MFGRTGEDLAVDTLLGVERLALPVLRSEDRRAPARHPAKGRPGRAGGGLTALARLSRPLLMSRRVTLCTLLRRGEGEGRPRHIAAAGALRHRPSPAAAPSSS